jgi:hypothetical protein
VFALNPPASAGPCHGYAFRLVVLARTDGALGLWPASLSGTLADLTYRGLIE